MKPLSVAWDELPLTVKRDACKRAIQQLSDNAWDIGTVSGVLQGVELTTTLLPNQKEAIASARKAIERIGERNRVAVEALAKIWKPSSKESRAILARHDKKGEPK